MKTLEHHHPSNKSLFLVGNFDLEKTVATISEQQIRMKQMEVKSAIKGEH